MPPPAPSNPPRRISRCHGRPTTRPQPGAKHHAVTNPPPCPAPPAHKAPLPAARLLRPDPSSLFPGLLSPESGLTLVELIITIAIVGILASAALPVARFQVKREKERELRRDLWAMRDAIDRYKDAADRGGFQIKIDTMGYPPDLETLVDGVTVQDKKVRFLRKIPVDPMTGSADWGLRSNQDDPESDSWGGQNVFEVHSKSYGTGLDGSKYSTW